MKIKHMAFGVDHVILVGNGDVETYYEANSDGGDTQRDSVEECLVWAGEYATNIYHVTRVLVGTSSPTRRRTWSEGGVKDVIVLRVYFRSYLLSRRSAEGGPAPCLCPAL